MTSGAENEEQVFLPITNSIPSVNNNQITIGSSVSIEYNQSGQHVSQIDDKGLHNILVLTGYAIDENTGELVPTFDPCDYVKGILISGRILEGNPFKIIKIIGIPSNKLYIIRKKDVHGNITFSFPIKINQLSTGTYQVDLGNKVTSFESLNGDVATKIVNEVLAKIYNLNLNDEQQKNKLRGDVQEIFNYYSI
jgi:hypothetical protein